MIMVVFFQSSFSASIDPAVFRGKNDFLAYCSGCHGLRYGLDGRSDPLIPALPATDAIQWFGQQPPELGLVGITRGGRWLDAYLNGYYIDHTARFGENNHLLKNLSMPNPFSVLTPEVKEKKISDIVAFLVFIADPSVEERHRIGPWVIFALMLLGLWIYRLKVSYWSVLDD